MWIISITSIATCILHEIPIFYFDSIMFTNLYALFYHLIFIGLTN